MDMRETTRAGYAGREALNAAFWDLGLRFQWDAPTWSVLVQLETLEAQIAYYLAHWQPHLLAVYEATFLARLVESRLSSGASGRMGMEAMTRA